MSSMTPFLIMLLIPLLWLFTWLRSEVRFEIAGDVLHLRAFAIGVIPRHLKIPLDGIIEVRSIRTISAGIRGLLHGDRFELAYPLAMGQPGIEGVLIVRRSGFFRVVLVMTSQSDLLLWELARHGIPRAPGTSSS